MKKNCRTRICSCRSWWIRRTLPLSWKSWDSTVWQMNVSPFLSTHCKTQWTIKSNVPTPLFMWILTLSMKETSFMPLLIATLQTCDSCLLSPSRWVSMAVRPTTGCGHVRLVTSLYSVFMPTRRPMVRQPIPRKMSPIIPNDGHKWAWKAIRTAISLWPSATPALQSVISQAMESVRCVMPTILFGHRYVA